jgi:16S rRNA (cytidine1402-2'-O)-methyltransferase
VSARPGRLVLVPNTLDLGTEVEVDLRDVLPQAVIARAAALGHWVAENAKTTRALLKRVDRLVPLALPLQLIHISELPRPAKGGPAGGPGTGHGGARGAAVADLAALLAPALAGHDLGLLSEAGLPAVADPGAALVQAAHVRGIAVEPLAGPSALLLALAASGLNGQSFAFIGYLPVDAAARATRIRALEAVSHRQHQTQIAIETPYRNDALLGALIEQLQPATRLAVACGLTLPGARCESRTVLAWRAAARQPLGSRLPAVFSWLAE